ncbi:MAG: hypothetical protein K0R14_2138 [Burkholderiales bacterium]|jgi:hypothetical protein|nr:hypothetical protein [Burkholderiales bacterium]
MNKIACLFFTTICAGFVVNVSGNTLGYNVPVQGSGLICQVCSDYDGRCYNYYDPSGRKISMGINKGFCTRVKDVFSNSYALYEVIDQSQSAELSFDCSQAVLVNAKQVFVGGSGTCPRIDPLPNAGITYTVRNDTSEPLTFLRVFTTENNGNQECPGCTYWHSWHIDNYVNGNGLKPGEYTSNGYTGWYDTNRSSYSGTRWYIIFSHGKDCFSTILYEDPPHDTSNVLAYTKDDLDLQKYYKTVVSINNESTNVYYPSRNSFPINQRKLVTKVGDEICKNWIPPVTP